MNEGILLLVTNEYRDDPRVFRAATAFAEHGRGVTVVALVDDSPHPACEDDRGVRIHRVAHDSGLFRRIRRRPVKAGAGAGAGAAPLPGSAGGGPEPPHGPSARVSITTQVLESAIFLNNNLRWFSRLRRLHPRLVYANDLDTLLTGAMISSLRGVPLVYDSHELFVEMFDPPRPVFTRMLSWLESRLVRRASLVITVNPSIADELSERYGIRAPIVVFNCPAFQEGAGSRKTGDGIRVIYHGGYAPDRGIEELLESSKYLVGGELFLRGLVSPPPHIREALEEGERPNGSVTARSLPRVPMTELVASLRGFDIGVIPYKATCLNNYYSSPNKLFEYMMGGLAIAAADLPEIRRVVEECENGVLFDPSDPRDIAAKINELASDRNRLERMKQNSLRGAAERYNWEAQKPRLLEAVDDCLDRGHLSRRGPT